MWLKFSSWIQQTDQNASSGKWLVTFQIVPDPAMKGPAVFIELELISFSSYLDKFGKYR